MQADGTYGVLWLTPHANEMEEADWNFPEGRFLSYVLGPKEQGEPPLFIVLNAAPEPIEFTLPKLPEYTKWSCVLDTTASEVPDSTDSGNTMQAPPRSVLAFAGAA